MADTTVLASITPKALTVSGVTAGNKTYDGTKAAADYAEQLGKIVAAVGVGVDTLGKLRNFQRPSDQAVSDFRDVSQYLVNVILQVAHDTDTDLPAAGATYAEAAG